jgi:hypothetical protein
MKGEQIRPGYNWSQKGEHGKRKNMYVRFRNHCMYENSGEKYFPFSDTIYCKSLGLEMHAGDTLGVGV